MGRERRVMWGEMFTIINIMKTKQGDETRKSKEIPSSTIHEDLKTDVNLILIPFSIFPHTLFLLISNSSKDLSKQSPHFTPTPPAPSQNSIIQQEP